MDKYKIGQIFTLAIFTLATVVLIILTPLILAGEVKLTIIRLILIIVLIILIPNSISTYRSYKKLCKQQQTDKITTTEKSERK